MNAAEADRSGSDRDIFRAEIIARRNGGDTFGKS